MKNLPRLGQRVTFLRIAAVQTAQPIEGEAVSLDEITAKTEIVSGTGLVQAVFLNPDRRPMVQVNTGKESFNVDARTIDFDDEFKDAYEKLHADVAKVTSEGNAVVAEIVADYNVRVDALYGSVLGEPIPMDFD